MNPLLFLLLRTNLNFAGLWRHVLTESIYKVLGIWPSKSYDVVISCVQYRTDYYDSDSRLRSTRLHVRFILCRNLVECLATETQSFLGERTILFTFYSIRGNYTVYNHISYHNKYLCNYRINIFIFFFNKKNSVFISPIWNYT